MAIRAGHRAAFTHAAQLWQAEHVAWAAWCAVAVVTTTRGRWRHLGWLYPAATALVVLASANHKRWETQMSATTFLQRATDSVTFAGGGKRWVFPQCREGADHD